MDQFKDIDEVINKITLCETQIAKGIIGQRDVVRQVMMAIFCDGNVLLESVPGLGKTQLVKTLSKVLGLSFSRIQFTPDLMPSDVTGTNLIIKNEDKNIFSFEQGPVFANLVLADEINRATPKTQSALLEAMQEKTVTAGKKTYALPSPFMVLATQNPIESEGTYPLPEAQLDRFMFKLNLSFPKFDELKKIMELTVCADEGLGSGLSEIAPVLDGNDILQIRSAILQLPMAEAVADYALKLVTATHPDSENAPQVTKKYVLHGVSPRAAQAIFKTARARALMEGRYNVSFEDVESVAFPSMRHRIITNFEAMADGKTNDQIIQEIMENIERF